MQATARAAIPRPAFWTLTWLLISALAHADPIEVLRECAVDAPKAARGLEKLDSACPELSSALADLGVDKSLTGGWRETLTPQALLDVAELSARYAASQIHSRPSIASLPAIIEAVDGQPAAPSSWWQKFNAWLKAWLDRQHSTLSGWFRRWLGEGGASPSLLKVAGMICMVLIVAAAAAIIVNELRTAGVWHRRWRVRSAAARVKAAVSQSPETASPAAARTDGIKQLLRQLVARLSQTHRLSNERSLTHRELIARSRWDDEAQRNVFARVAKSAEQMTYGAARQAESSSLMAEGQKLLAQLDNEPA